MRKLIWLTLLLSGPLFAVELDDSDRGDTVLYFPFNDASLEQAVGKGLNSSGQQVNVNLDRQNDSQKTGVRSDDNGYVHFDSENVFRASNVGPYLRQCDDSDGITFETWVAPEHTKDSTTKNDIIVHFANYLTLYQHYDNGPLYKVTIGNTTLETDPNVLKGNGDFGSRPQKVVVSIRKDGLAKLYVSTGVEPNKKNVIILRGQGTATMPKVGSSNVNMAVGNSYAPNYQREDTHESSRTFAGKVYNIAVSCGYQGDEEVTQVYGFKNKIEKVSINPNARTDVYAEKAATIYRRIASVKVPVDHPVVQEMANRMAQGEDPAKVAKLVTEEKGFYNVTLRDFAAELSNREETINVPLNDFIATLIGIVKDDRSAKLFLTGTEIYYGDSTKVPLSAEVYDDIINSNKHYEQLDELNADLSVVLSPMPQQIGKESDGVETVSRNTDAAGLLTTRAFISAHHIAGTGRRPVEFAFREFLCLPIDQIADSGKGDAHVLDNRIGRDIDRAPGGEATKFENNCKACHVPMDGFRGAFAYYSWVDSRINYSLMEPENDEFDQNGVATKFNENSDMYPGGYVTVDNSFKNYAIGKKNMAQIGWDNPSSGVGVKDFGRQLANTEAFPRCMAKRVYKSVCKREPVAAEDDFIEKMADVLKNEQYNLKRLFENIAVSKECIGG
ncbi:MAG: hypothetical protein VX642_16165 [Bdellovibrionota bacterium]|nr:hypothetical protein [Bdellovibrionota bacterium]